MKYVCNIGEEKEPPHTTVGSRSRKVALADLRQCWDPGSGWTVGKRQTGDVLGKEEGLHWMRLGVIERELEAALGAGSCARSKPCCWEQGAVPDSFILLGFLWRRVELTYSSCCCVIWSKFLQGEEEIFPLPRVAQQQPQTCSECNLDCAFEQIKLSSLCIFKLFLIEFLIVLDGSNCNSLLVALQW